MSNANDLGPTRRGRAHAPRRTHATLVRFGSAEREIVRARAHEAGRPVACFIREMAIGSPAPKRPRPVPDAVIRDMTEVTNSLAALSHELERQAPTLGTRLDAACSALVGLIHRLGRPPDR